MTEKKLYLIAHRPTEPRWKYNEIPQLYPEPAYADYHKIGISDDPERRVRILNGGTPHELELTTTLESDDAQKVESMLHTRLSASLQNGEWFHLTSNTINSLVALDELNVDDLETCDRYIPKWLIETSLYIHVMNQRGEC